MSHMRRRPNPSGGQFPDDPLFNPRRLPFQAALSQVARRYPLATLLVVALIVIALLLYGFVQQRRELARHREQGQTTTTAPEPPEARPRPATRSYRPHVPVLPGNAQPGGGSLAMPAVLRSAHFIHGMPRPTDDRFNLRLP